METISIVIMVVIMLLDLQNEYRTLKSSMTTDKGGLGLCTFI